MIDKRNIVDIKISKIHANTMLIEYRLICTPDYIKTTININDYEKLLKALINDLI